MFKQPRWTRLAAAILAVVLSSGPSRADEPTASREQTLVVGRVSQDPVKTLPRLRAMAAYLETRLASAGITASEVIVVRSNAEMVELLRSGAVDMVSETAMSAFQFVEKADAEILLREWKRGVAEYESILIVGRNSGITMIEELRDHVIAFEDPGSTSGFLMPMALLSENGICAVQLAAPGQRPPAGCVGYLFTNGEINIAAWVARGITDAGALNNLDWADESRTPPALQAELDIFMASPRIPRSVVLVRGNTRPELRAALRDTLIGMEADELAVEVLKIYYGVSRYDPFVGQTALDLAAVQRHYEAVRARLQ
ncbi:MAG: phosphate/phosphite/phosphonate ABC transporter substrate-binding protein [Inquilinus sp.]|nr:phosphate/phosphite/phosphonate ABC transporter substrate-binding protein [Inquilinus sp.]